MATVVRLKGSRTKRSLTALAIVITHNSDKCVPLRVYKHAQVQSCGCMGMHVHTLARGVGCKYHPFSSCENAKIDGQRPLQTRATLTRPTLLNNVRGIDTCSISAELATSVHAVGRAKRLGNNRLVSLLAAICVIVLWLAAEAHNTQQYWQQLHRQV